MKRAVFVDTSGWKAYLDLKDSGHRLAREVFEKCRREKLRLCTSDYVVSETLTLLRMRPGLGHAIACQFGRLVEDSQAIEFLFVTPKLFQKAWQIFKRYDDKDFSFVDCTSFALMEDLKLTQAIAFDSHFTQYGFVCLS